MTAPDPTGQGATSWLPPLEPFTNYGGDWQKYEDALYAFFRADFIHSKPNFPNRRWAVKRHPASKGKECTFWHCISEGKEEGKRVPDLRRCERIRWPRPMIDAFASTPVRCWRTTRGRANRVLIATGDFSYVVVLEDRATFVMLWTAFPVDLPNRRRDLRRDCEAFESKLAKGLVTL